MHGGGRFRGGLVIKAHRLRRGAAGTREARPGDRLRAVALEFLDGGVREDLPHGRGLTVTTFFTHLGGHAFFLPILTVTDFFYTSGQPWTPNSDPYERNTALLPAERQGVGYRPRGVEVPCPSGVTRS